MSLAEIMQFLAPPQQDYESLAQELSRYRTTDTLELIVKAYFEVFANGYDFWQANYDYPRVFEYFYCAYLVADDIITNASAVALGGIPQKTLRSFFENLSLALLYNTYCENAMLCNVTNDLFSSAEKARDYAEMALKILEEQLWSDLSEEQCQIFEYIKTYININLKLYNGYAKCAELYLLRWSPQKDSLNTGPDLTTVIKDWLNKLRPESRELFSELRTHLITASRLLHDYETRGATSLIVKQADLYLRATAYAGPHLTEPVFEIFNDKEQGRPELLKKLQEITGLRAADVHTGGFLDDSLETILAGEICNRLVFDFPAGEDNTGITVLTYDGDKEIHQRAEEITVEISKRGNVTIEIKFNLGDPGADISMSHLRFMNALLSPHIGTLNIIWHGESVSDNPENAAVHSLRAEAVNYVADYLACVDWYKQAEKINAVPSSERDKLVMINKSLESLKTSLFELTASLRNPAMEDPNLSVERGERQTPHVSIRDLEKVLGVYELLRTQFQNWGWLIADFPEDGTPEQRVTWQKGRELFPPKGSRHYIRLIDICKELMGVEDKPDESENTNTFVQAVEAAEPQQRKGFKGFLEQLTYEASKKAEIGQDDAEPKQAKTNPDVDDYDQWQYDPNLGWQSILVVNRLAKRTLGSDGYLEMEPLSEAEQKEILSHPEFKGFAIGRQEVGGLDDWMYAVDPTKLNPPLVRNLAYVRSHDADVVYVGPNNVCLYMINNPQFLVDVTFEVTRLIGDVRAIVLAYHMNARQVVENLAKMLEAHAPKQQIGSFRQETLHWRREITMFFELMRDLPISRYQDHADMMREMLKDSGINEWLNRLSQSVSTLDNLLKITEELK